ncbi:GntR family transcriptional regulator [Nakamurella sp. PAMC28650]|uniref:GntR family transcriptional regulator n=1 Tax=Nakamurella sp. PAMC28650 TaxID=2762325 RepID=UPI00164DC37F|nr:GntR family transcriptional regulator [Nakamurella sp. PAMC28650]QNK82636.1 GntR family transcriptional regulator [Nakamurella sp. PAMC28650]
MIESAAGATSLPGLSHDSIAISAATWITDRILEGRIGPGEKVTEASLAEQMGVSRSPVREALRALSRGGLIIVEPRRGAFVAELDQENAADLYACRLLLEPRCSAMGVQEMDDRRADSLTEIFGRMRVAADQRDTAAYVLALKDYNWNLLDACPNRLLFGFAESSWQASLRYWDLLVRSSPHYLTKSLRRNKGIQAAIESRNPVEVERVATAVLEFGRDELMKLLSRLPSKQPSAVIA